jgi:hypothetical protein
MIPSKLTGRRVSSFWMSLFSLNMMQRAIQPFLFDAYFALTCHFNSWCVLCIRDAFSWQGFTPTCLRVLIGATFDARLLTLGESYCEVEARTVFENMLTQVHIVGEGYD